MRIVNRRARFKYSVIDKIEAGIVLTGAEIKSIRAGRVDLSGSFARIENGEAYLLNANITPWMGSEKYVDARRKRKLLLKKSQIFNLQGKIEGSKFTLAPLSIYIKENLAKVELGLVKSKSQFDKRAGLKKAQIQRDVARELRGEKG